ncbi:family 10 glycosylhydrolase [Terrimonas rubra]|uniref:Family 10 glycosylhydrolase n=1 Tax=Terrimonas rubra TaxID=1035890 RepID=A0ABW5ZZP9_9BACT
MRLRFTLVTCLLLFLCSIAFSQQPSRFQTDDSLYSLAKKYVRSPIKKITHANGDVFLQRDMTPYLSSKLSHNPADYPANDDYGHDHGSDQLIEFLNRPHPNVATLQKYFTQAAAEFNVPVSLLHATAQVQSNWAQVSSSMYGSWGVMGIIENQFVQQISEAAALLNTTADAIKTNARTNIRAAAALLAKYQQGKPASSNPTDWFDAMKKLTGLTDEKLQHELAVRIYDVITHGSKTVTLWQEIINIPPAGYQLEQSVMFPAPETPVNNPPSASREFRLDYPLAVYNFTTCNYGARTNPSVVNFYFIHYVATGTYQGAINWFKDCSSSVSAHYVIRNTDGVVSQVVAESSRAFSQGVNLYNQEGIGVEHEVLATNLAMWDSEPMLNSAARLAANVCDRWGIPRTRRVTDGEKGIYGHSDIRSTDCPNLTPERWTVLLNKIAAATPVTTLNRPVLQTVMSQPNSTQVTASWLKSNDFGLVGYRLYYATNDAATTWALAANETTLTANTTSVTLQPSQFIVPPTGNVHHFRITAIVNNQVNPIMESPPSDAYSRSSGTTGQKVLIVDGYDRPNGSYTGGSHIFSTMYFRALRDNEALQINSVANEVVETGAVNLRDYDIVVWYVGDESSVEEVFSTAEKNAIKNYLDNGGKILISGSEIAYNVSRPASATYDAEFATTYLRSTYVADGAANYTPATGIAGTMFEGLNIPFGITYPEDFPDAIEATNGGVNILNYAIANRRGGVGYKGIFKTTTPGTVIFLSFTLETAAQTSITSFMDKALDYFAAPYPTTPPLAIDDNAGAQSGIAQHISILNNDIKYGVAIDTASIAITTEPLSGTATISPNGYIIYVSNAGFTGTDQFSYQMKNKNGQLSNIATVTITVTSTCGSQEAEPDPNRPKRELRGSWVSSVSNIDWPSSRTLTTAQQQAELVKILDSLQATNINTVFLQVRPEADALYASNYEPWSYWLTNAQGTAPNPLWDPLQFAIDGAHARGMELHAWINPFRAKQSTPALASGHVASQHPDWTFVSGTITMLNPGIPQVRKYITDVVADIAGRYNVDGIHFDDYFYPYAGMTGQDDATYTTYNPGNITNINDWRRDNINRLIAQVYDTIQYINNNNSRNVIFGVSPFGIWKSGTPAGITGTSSFSSIYCDPIAWLQAGKVDYIAPQLYWKITGAQDYAALSQWWNDQGVLYNRFIYPGLALYKMADDNNWAGTEIENQISLNKAASREQIKGQILFSNKQLMGNVKNIKTLLQNNHYQYKALNPILNWKETICPNPPSGANIAKDTLYWNAPEAAADGDLAKKYVVYRFANAAQALSQANNSKHIYAITNNTKVHIPLPVGGGLGNYYVVSSVDKNNNESAVSNGVTYSLPVVGLQLNVVLNGNVSNLDWSTLSETNSSYFAIERSTDSVNFKRLTSVAAAGNSTDPLQYRDVDVLNTIGVYHYRIRMVSSNGTITYSNIVTVRYGNNYENVLVAPNPFTTGFTVYNLQNATTIQVINLAGQTMLTEQLTGQSVHRIEAPALAPGVYQVKVTFANKKTTVVKVVKL